MTETLQTPFTLGATYFAAKTAAAQVRVPCPVCRGTGVVVVLYGGDERVPVECEACGLGFEQARGFIEEYDLTPAVTPVVLVGVVSLHDGRWSVRANDGTTYDFHDLFATEDAARQASVTQCAAAHERNMQSHQHKRQSAKRATWTAFYHRKQIADLKRQLAWHEARLSAQSKGGRR